VNLSLIISTFDQPDYLDRVLRSISRQTVTPSEVLIADDGSGQETEQVFEKWRKDSSFPIQRVWQPHDGFRKARILNEAVSRARHDYLVFLDGDMLAHPNFIADHAKLARVGFFVQGHRVLIEQEAAEWFGRNGLGKDRWRAMLQGQMKGMKLAFRWPFAWKRIRSDQRGIRGCNFGLWRDDMLRVNGYNEEFVGWGREDSEFASRLMNAGLKRLDARGWAICYHLWHPPAARTQLAANDQLLAQVQTTHAIRCERGLDQHLAKR
jgi:glycosyltransferase involved in cell wall biosynthesis